MKKFIKKIRITHVIIFVLLGLAIFQFTLANKLKSLNNQNRSISNITPQCYDSISRGKGFKFIKPLREVKPECESEAMQFIKTDIAKRVASFKDDSSIISASVYLEDFKNNDWIGYNAFEKFIPGSLLKIPLLITYLRLSETQPELLNKKLLFERHNDFGLQPVFVSKTPLKLGKKYSVRELLYYTIANSNNDAFSVLADYLYNTSNNPAWDKTYTDLGFSVPDSAGLPYPISAREYSMFMEVIFNAGYLNEKSSEYACELLSECDFTEGIKKSLPDSILLVHKFGESGNPNFCEIHETGIIYLNNSPYLLTIMTRGKYILRLPYVVSELSKVVYDDMVRLHSN